MINGPLAVALALFSTFGFGTGFVLTQFALRWMQPRLGAAFSIPTSTLLFWCLAPFSINLAEVDLSAAGLFAVIGLLFPAAVALLNFESNRLMGPNIAGAVGGLSPLFAVLLAVMLLGEHLRFLQLCGTAAIAAGVILMYIRPGKTFTARQLWPLVLPLGASAIRGFVQPVIKLELGGRSLHAAAPSHGFEDFQIADVHGDLIEISPKQIDHITSNRFLKSPKNPRSCSCACNLTRPLAPYTGGKPS